MKKRLFEIIITEEKFWTPEHKTEAIWFNYDIRHCGMRMGGHNDTLKKVMKDITEEVVCHKVDIVRGKRKKSVKRVAFR
jgi:hypothetical protein